MSLKNAVIKFLFARIVEKEALNNCFSNAFIQHLILVIIDSFRRQLVYHVYCRSFNL